MKRLLCWLGLHSFNWKLIEGQIREAYVPGVEPVPERRDCVLQCGTCSVCGFRTVRKP